jgi:DNA-binding transcriptional LysR family regulator
MELRHLRYFVAVAEEQNVTRAAARLHVSQPPVSRQIRDLEQELGVALFEHGAKAVRLTDAGRVFLNEARAVLQRADESVQMVKAVGSGQRGEIHVGYAPSLTAELLPCALRLYQETNPGVRIQLHDLSTEEMLRGLRDGSLQVAWMPQPSGNAGAGLEFEGLCSLAVCVAMHPAHRLARARKVGMEQLAGEQLITFTRADYPEYHEWVTHLFGPLKRRPMIAEEHDGATSLIASIEAGRGVALVLEGFDRLAGARLKIRRLVPAPPLYVVGVACRKNGASAFTKSFVGAVKRAKSQKSV